ncbi:histidine phosphatase superfamily [Phlebopus sp. FC_14]|nr:histidine phosphatase superfamily [Phlebopus sp. FC_14]
MITVSFIRHGESTDNLRSVWAGWADAPLTNHGMNQARALGESYANTRLDVIYASPLKRAFTTAQALYDSQPSPKPTFTASPLIREQHFGKGEGKTWTLHQDPNKTLEEHFANDHFPVLHGRDEKFPGGESVNDLAQRADQAIRELVLPHVREATKSEGQDVHIALVSHGLCISQLVAALVNRNDGGAPDADYRGLMNTAWTRVTVQVKGPQLGETLVDNLPPLIVKVTDVNRHEHIDGIKRQEGGIGSSAYDPKQQDIRGFFGGGAVKGFVQALENSESDVEGTQEVRN